MQTVSELEEGSDLIESTRKQAEDEKSQLNVSVEQAPREIELTSSPLPRPASQAGSIVLKHVPEVAHYKQGYTNSQLHLRLHISLMTDS